MAERRLQASLRPGELGRREEALDRVGDEKHQQPQSGRTQEVVHRSARLLAQGDRRLRRTPEAGHLLESARKAARYIPIFGFDNSSAVFMSPRELQPRGRGAWHFFVKIYNMVELMYKEYLTSA